MLDPMRLSHSLPRSPVRPPAPVMTVLATALAAAVLGLGATATARAQQAGPAGAAAQGALPLTSPSFELVIDAPATVRPLLERHLELGRYREVPDLDEVELARLLVLAERDARRLLGAQGFFNPRIDLATDTGLRPPRVTLRVEPGEPARVEGVDIRFEGDLATTGDEAARAQRASIREGWGLRPGMRFTQEDWDAAKAAAARALVARRYPRGRIAGSQADIDAQAGTAQLGLRLDSGPLFRLGPLQVTGTQRYDPRLVPRLARLDPGSEFDQDRIERAQQRLTGSGYYDSAFIVVDPEGDPLAAPVQVNVREAPLQKLVLGVGLTTDRGPRLSLEHRHNRVPGVGWRADTRLAADRRTPSAETEWTAIPDARGWRWGVLARAERLEDDTQVTHAQRLRVGRSQAGERIDRNVYVQLDRATVRSASGVQPEDTGDGVALAANFVWSTRRFDRVVQPQAGWGLGIEFGGGVTLAGRSVPFQRSVARWLQYWPLSAGRLQLRAEGGAVLAQPEARVPVTQLFRTGGDTSVRGYGYREIGVERPGGTISAGRYLAVGSLEWQRPIRRDGVATPWEHTLFLDAGAVADSVGGLSPSAGVGTGVRYASPVGPLQADIAYGLKTRKLRVHLTVGVTF